MALWIECPTVLDTPARIWVFSVTDFTLMFAAMPVLGLVTTTPKSIVGGLALGLLFYYAKRGRAPGAVLHWLYEMLSPWFWLPGLLPPRLTTYSPW